MNRTEFQKYITDFFDRCSGIMTSKNADYAHEDDNPWGNLGMCESIGFCQTEHGIFIRMTDKMARLTTFIKRGTFEVDDESISDTLMDLANYAAIMAAKIEERNNEG